MFSIKTHNGCITIYNPATGKHRTFRIRTQKEDAKFAPGARIVSVLRGPENTSDYKGFGFVQPDGRITLWSRYRDDLHRAYANMLQIPERYPTAVYKFEGKCRVCNRKLTRPDSIDSGIGAKCASRTGAKHSVAA